MSDVETVEPMKADNAQRIGSVTKSFTVTRILQLAAEGRLDLDDPVRRYVPNVRGGAATLRELANMTSGIFNYTEDLPFILRLVLRPTDPTTDRQIVNVANGHAPYFQPGTGWHYSNTNTVILGVVVEKVTGNRIGPEIVRNVVRPLGLARTIFPTGITLRPPFSHGYATFDTDVGRVDVTKSSPSGSSAAGAMVSTLEDLFQWGRSLARGSLVTREMQRERLRMTAFLPRAIPVGRPRLRLRGKARLSPDGSVLELRGVARSEAGILLVDAGRRARVMGGESWKLTTPLQPGRNVVHLCAVDRRERVSRAWRVVIAGP
jgi:D-alanyl-D-alanine carboxypeptidase